MIEVALSGQQIEFEWTVDGQDISDWSLVREEQGKWEYRSGAFEVHLSVQKQSEKVVLVSVVVEKGGAAFDLNRFKVRLRSPLRDLHRVWMPNLLLEGQLERVSLQWGFAYLTAANRCMPFVACLNRAGRNRASIGLMDQTTETEVRGCGFDAEARYVIELSRPIEGITLRTKEYREDVYLNCGEGSWFDAMTDFTQTYDALTGVQMPKLHPNAADPLYCTWYAHGRMVDQEKVLAELDLVRELGFRNYVIDEGWFGRGPEAAEFRGDYTPNPKKFPDMMKVVDAVHARGMNILLWVSPFQIAKKSLKYPELKRYLNQRDRLGELPYFRPMLSPWVSGTVQKPDVEERGELCPRTGITETYVPELVAGLIRDYHLDGLKIDFVDQVSVLPCTADHEHIYPTVGEAMARTMQAMDAAIRKVKPDAIIEFRLPYANIFLRPFATLYRAQDCPWDWDQNRRQCAWIQSFTPGYGPLAEADYISWRADERDENVAKAVMSAILYCVPSIGMDFQKLPESHLKIVKHWLEFYQAHKEEIVRGQWQPLEFDPHTSTFAIYGVQTTFVGLFKDVLGRIVLDGEKPLERLYLFNGANTSCIHTRLEPMEGEYELIVFDPFLEEVGRSKAKDVDGGLNLSLTVPEGGMVEGVRIGREGEKTMRRR
ncbi:MAG: hypothetical protein DRP97_01310 [Candidatus Latescibacterota bacterium]|nr:MAG: hypothetical protein DRP97_01310 [Candidatus Latescibacterota bacterium]